MTELGGPLDDITVVEVANWVAAPSCAALMADMGARVLKIEPLSGDGMRGKNRQPVLPKGAPETDYAFELDNRGKRSLAIDLRDPRGADLIREITLHHVDVFITNLRPGRLRRYDIGPDRLRAADPSLVYAFLTGYGAIGEDADRAAFDLTAFFARGGIMGLIGEPTEPPPAFRPGQGDHPTGLALLVAILAALRERDRSGEGQVVETALLRTAAWTIGCDMAAALVDRRQPSRRSRTEPISPMHTRYRCADGAWVVVVTQHQGLWERFCDAIGRVDLADDERFATPADRLHAGASLMRILDAVFAAHPLSYWASRLDRAGVVWAKVADLADLVDDPQAHAMEMYAEIDHPIAGPFQTLASPFAMSRSTVAVRGPAPRTGEHTRAVLRELGIADERVASLLDSGVVSDGATV